MPYVMIQLPYDKGTPELKNAIDNLRQFCETNQNEPKIIIKDEVMKEIVKEAIYRGIDLSSNQGL